MGAHIWCKDSSSDVKKKLTQHNKKSDGKIGFFIFMLFVYTFSQRILHSFAHEGDVHVFSCDFTQEFFT